jgi:hypothetical protein
MMQSETALNEIQMIYESKTGSREEDMVYQVQTIEDRQDLQQIRGMEKKRRSCWWDSTLAPCRKGSYRPAVTTRGNKH